VVFIEFTKYYSEDFAMAELKDVMTKKVMCIKKDTSVRDAIRLMAEKNITGIPVVEDDMTLLGIISEQDVLRLLHTFQEENDKLVSDFMTQPAIHFDESESLMDVCACLKDNSIRRVPVTSKGKVVGVVTRSDILRCILGLWKESAVQSASA
jgi:CBS domain-containing protein